MATCVKFDVGGVIHSISLALLKKHPNTMMAQMATTNKLMIQGPKKRCVDGNLKQLEPLFIEGDGDRFKFVRDYMRSGKVHLPNTQVSKEALLDDLEYYGFENVPPEAIQDQAGMEAKQAKELQDKLYFQPEKELKKRREALKKKLRKLSFRLVSFELAQLCHYEYKSTGNLELSVNHEEMYDIVRTCHGFGPRWKRDKIKKHFDSFGLEFKDVTLDYCNAKFEVQFKVRFEALE